MKFGKYLFLLACFIPLLIFRDFTPNNELRYLSIADEALRNGTFFTFYNHGIPYADKPPLYLWIIMLGKWLLGEHYMFFLGLFSLIPALLLLYIFDRWTNSFLSQPQRQCAQLMLITSGLFTGAAIVIRMDMLMSLFIVLSLYTFYQMYSGSSRFSSRYLLPVWIFLAIFSKGPMGLLIPLFSITFFLLAKKQIRKMGHYLGGLQWGILLLLCAIWFIAVYAEGGKEYLHNLLFHQTVNRAVHAFHHQEPFYYYLKTIWYSLAPWTLFYLTAIMTGIKHIRTDLERLFLTVILTTFVALSLFSGKLDIYLLPVFPFFTYLSWLLYSKLPQKPLAIAIAVPAILLLFTLPAFYIASFYIHIPVKAFPYLFCSSLLLSLFALTALILLLRYQKFYASANSISAGLLLSILIASFSILSFNSSIGFKTMADKAENLAHQYKIDDFYFYQFRSGENLDSYLKKEVNKIDRLQLLETDQVKPFILFVRNKDIYRDTELLNLLNKFKSYSTDTYSIILYNIKE